MVRGDRASQQQTTEAHTIGLDLTRTKRDDVECWQLSVERRLPADPQTGRHIVGIDDIFAGRQLSPPVLRRDPAPPARGRRALMTSAEQATGLGVHLALITGS